MTGIIKNYNKERGFGFIAADNGTDYFFHISDVIKSNGTAEPEPKANEFCAFEVQPCAKGTKAVNVTVISEA